jgi:hypothetical protein
MIFPFWCRLFRRFSTALTSQFPSYRKRLNELLWIYSISWCNTASWKQILSKSKPCHFVYEHTQMESVMKSIVVPGIWLLLRFSLVLLQFQFGFGFGFGFCCCITFHERQFESFFLIAELPHNDSHILQFCQALWVSLNSRSITLYIWYQTVCPRFLQRSPFPRFFVQQIPWLLIRDPLLKIKNHWCSFDEISSKYNWTFMWKSEKLDHYFFWSFSSLLIRKMTLFFLCIWMSNMDLQTWPETFRDVWTSIENELWSDQLRGSLFRSSTWFKRR